MKAEAKTNSCLRPVFSRVHATIFQYLLHNFLLSICHQIHNTWQIPCITFLLVKLSYHQSRVVVSYFFNFHPYLLEKKGSIEFLWLAFFDWVVQLNHPNSFQHFHGVFTPWLLGVVLCCDGDSLFLFRCLFGQRPWTAMPMAWHWPMRWRAGGHGKHSSQYSTWRIIPLK